MIRLAFSPACRHKQHMATATSPQCSICKRPIEHPPENKWFPFCSNRCKVIDLSKWLSGDYKIPALDDEPDDGSTPDGQGELH